MIHFNHKKTRFLFFLLVFCFLFNLGAKSRDEHDKDICSMLIGDRNYYRIVKSRVREIEMICDAVYLTTDFTLSSRYAGTRALVTLQDGGVEFLPSLEELSSGVKGGPYHEKYTHMGWDYDYTDKYDFYVQPQWLKRKKLLTDTLVKVFDFDLLSKSKYKFACKEATINKTQVSWISSFIQSFGNKIDSMAALLYYVHLLGDIENNSEKTAQTRSTMEELRPDLTHHIKILFGSKIKKYPNLIYALNDKSENAQQLLSEMSKSVPFLLREELFYKKFYTTKIRPLLY